MFKIDQITNIFDCDECNSVLVDPVTVSCGNNVCKKHLDAILEDVDKETNTFKCKCCYNEHSIPKEGFSINKRIKKALEIELNNLQLTPIYYECKKSIEDAKESEAEIESVARDPENYLYEYFENIKRDVELRREELKEKIDTYSDEMIKQIEASRVNCIKLSKDIADITAELSKSKQEMDDLSKKFDSFDFSMDFEDLKKNADILKDKFNEMLLNYKDSLLDKREYSFYYDRKKSMRTLLGYFKVPKNFKR